MNNTWESTDITNMITNIFTRLQTVLCNILKGGGGNNHVEKNRGVSGRKIKIEKEILELRECNKIEVIDLRNFETSIYNNDDENEIFHEI